MYTFFFDSVKRRTLSYSISPVLTNVESPQLKPENSSSTVQTWNACHSRTLQTSLHQIQHLEELQWLIGYHYRGYILSGFRYRTLNPKESVSHGNASTRSLCFNLQEMTEGANVFSSQEIRPAAENLEPFFLCKTISKWIVLSNEPILRYVLTEIYWSTLQWDKDVPST